jgi:methyl-accepting chemotaxis protein
MSIRNLYHRLDSLSLNIKMAVASLFVVALLVVGVLVFEALKVNSVERALTGYMGQLKDMIFMSTYDSLKKGNMHVFNNMVREIGGYEDVAEFSLVHTDGVVAYSSIPDKVGRDAGYKFNPEHEVSFSENGNIVYHFPVKTIGYCLRCHTGWEPDKVNSYYLVKLRTNALASVQKMSLISDIFVLICGGTLIVIIYFLVNKLVIKNVNRMRNIISEASNNLDLSLRSDIDARDEMGEISKSYNSFIGIINRDISGTFKAMAKVMEQILPLSFSAIRIMKMNDETLRLAGEVATASEQVSATIQDSAENIQSSSMKADETLKLSEDGGVAMEETTKLSEEVRGFVGSLSTQMQELLEASNEVANILQVIKDITEQTNLLALNAAIEAARAGEAGRGFAVVASEVRNLAEKTQKSASDITDVVDTMQSRVKAAVANAGHTLEIVNNQVDMAALANQKFNGIKQSVEELNSFLIHIASAAQQQSAATTQIALNIENVAKMSEGNSVGIEHMVKGVEVVAQQLEDSESELKKFILDDKTLPFINAKIAHVLMMKSIYSALQNGTRFEVSSYENCAFTKYYHREGMELFGRDSDYMALDVKHKNLHAEAMKVKASFEKHDLRPETLEKLQAEAQEFIRILNILIDKYS